MYRQGSLTLSQAQDVMGKCKDMLKCSCSQNILRSERLEHQSYRLERNFTDRERMSRGALSRVWQLGAPLALEWGFYIYTHIHTYM
jgi:hypothetical protein